MNVTPGGGGGGGGGGGDGDPAAGGRAHRWGGATPGSGGGAGGGGGSRLAWLDLSGVQDAVVREAGFSGDGVRAAGGASRLEAVVCSGPQMEPLNALLA